MNKKDRSLNFFDKFTYIGENLWNFLSINDKWKVSYLILIIHFSSFLELFSITSVIPLIGFLLDPYAKDGFFSHIHNKFFSEYDYFNYIISIFLLLTLIAGLSKIYVQNRIIFISHSLGSKLSIKIFKKIFQGNYQKVYQQNSSEYVASIMLRSNALLNSGILSFLNILNAIVMILIVLSFVVFYNIIFSIFFFSITTFLYFIILYFSKKSILKNGLIVAENNSILVKFIQETYGLLRDIKLNKLENYFFSRFKTLSDKFRFSQGKNVFYSVWPSLLVETILFLSVGISLIFLEQVSSNPLETIGVFAFIGIRLLPYINKTVRSLTASLADYDNIYFVFQLFRKKDLSNEGGKEKITKKSFINNFKKLKLLNINFKFDKSKSEIIKGLNLVINKNDKIGIYGDSGSGKSTLLDLITGILLPTSGKMQINNKKFITKKDEFINLFSYVPQKYFIFNDTIKNNIILNKPYDEDLFNKITKITMLNNYIAKFRNKAEQIIGDGGLALSGGQKQRVIIARALYANKEIILFDEATSALDKKAELKLIDNLLKLKKKTVVLVSHNIEIIKRFDKIFKFENKKLCRKK